MSEMHDVVTILLERMKDYPEDFFSVPNPNTYYDTRASKWYRAAQIINDVVTEEEKAALHAATLEAKRAVYMGAALKTILSDDESEEDKPYLTMKTQGRYATSLGQSMLATSQAMNNAIAIDKALAVEGSSSLMSQLEAKQKAAEIDMQRQYALSEYSNSFSVSGSALG